MPIQLHPWQSKALKTWHRAGRKGIIEAVTDSGKTYVAFGALEQLQAEDKRLNTLIVVPTVPLMNQWIGKLSHMLIPLTPVVSFSRNRLGLCAPPSPIKFGML